MKEKKRFYEYDSASTAGGYSDRLAILQQWGGNGWEYIDSIYRGDECTLNFKREIKVTLEDTVEMMLSSDYKERFKAEYWQVIIRICKLKQLLQDNEDGNLNFEPTCPINLLEEQLRYMICYMWKLKDRAKLEKIELNP